MFENIVEDYPEHERIANVILIIRRTNNTIFVTIYKNSILFDQHKVTSLKTNRPLSGESYQMLPPLPTQSCTEDRVERS